MGLFETLTGSYTGVPQQERYKFIQIGGIFIALQVPARDLVDSFKPW